MRPTESNKRTRLFKPRTIEAVRAALEAAGIEFIPENGGGAGVRLRKRVGPTDEGLRPQQLTTENTD